MDGFLEIFELEKAADEEYLRKIGYEPNIIDGIGYVSLNSVIPGACINLDSRTPTIARIPTALKMSQMTMMAILHSHHLCHP